MGKKNSKKSDSSTNKSSAAPAVSSASFPSSLWQPEPKHRPALSLQDLHSDYSTIWIIPKFLQLAECKAWIRYLDSETWEYTQHPATRHVASRECHRMQRQDVATANLIYQRLVNHVNLLQQQDTLQVPGWTLTGCNPNVRIYKYEKGMAFGRHVDGSNTLPAVQGGNDKETKMTVLIYLSACGGGATRFWHPTIGRKNTAFAPEPGAMLLHVHGDDCLEHEADPVTSGVKYVLRTDLVYERNG